MSRQTRYRGARGSIIVFALDIAGIFETLAKSAQTVRDLVRRSGFEKPDYRHRRLLRPRRDRPSSCRAAEQRDELATFCDVAYWS